MTFRILIYFFLHTVFNRCNRTTSVMYDIYEIISGEFSVGRFRFNIEIYLLYYYLQQPHNILSIRDIRTGYYASGFDRRRNRRYPVLKILRVYPVNLTTEQNKFIYLRSFLLTLFFPTRSFIKYITFHPVIQCNIVIKERLNELHDFRKFLFLRNRICFHS